MKSTEVVQIVVEQSVEPPESPTSMLLCNLLAAV